jgi:hypothetical protein
MKVRVLHPKPMFAMITRVAPGRTECKFGGRIWSLEWASGSTAMKLTTLQTMQDFASDCANPKLGARRLTVHLKIGKKVVVASELGPFRSKLTFTLHASIGSGVERVPSVPRGVIIFHDDVVCADEHADVPGIVPDWKAIDEEAYANPIAIMPLVKKP